MECGAGAAFAAGRRRRGTKLSRRDIPPIGMIGFEIAGILMLLSLGVGLLVGTSWNIHALDLRYRSLATERRELNDWRRALQEASLAASSPAATRTDGERDIERVRPVFAGVEYGRTGETWQNVTSLNNRRR